MKHRELDMTKTVLVTTRVEPAVKKKLRAIAASTKRSESFLANEAIEAFVSANEWQVELIKQRLDAAKRGAPSVPFDRVKEWMESWGTGHDLPKPKP
jgi:predicted transcriptional regulator